MDDYMFRHYVNECRTVDEVTSYLEIFNYSVRFLAVELYNPAPGIAVLCNCHALRRTASTARRTVPVLILAPARTYGLHTYASSNFSHVD